MIVVQWHTPTMFRKNTCSSREYKAQTVRNDDQSAGLVLGHDEQYFVIPCGSLKHECNQKTPCVCDTHDEVDPAGDDNYRVGIARYHSPFRFSVLIDRIVRICRIYSMRIAKEKSSPTIIVVRRNDVGGLG